MCQNPIKIIVNKEEYTVPCGRCFQCRKKRAQDWAIKLIEENKYHKKKCFITLTFDNKILQKGNEYGAKCKFLYHIENSKEYVQKFIKRLRKHFKNDRITYFAVGEYGEKTKRCHWHIILWGINFEEDRQPTRKSKSGKDMFTSPTLDRLWDCGICVIEDININNTVYCTQYILKKFKRKDDRYKEKIMYSNRSKISCKWARRNYNIIKQGTIKEDNKIFSIPKSYKENLKNSNRIEHREAYRKYEETIQKYFSNIDNNDYIKRQQNQEKIWESRNKIYNNSRDF